MSWRFRLIWIASIYIRTFMRRWMPSNRLLDKVCTRRGLKWGVPAMLLATPYLYLASLLAIIVRDGGPGSLNLFVLISVRSALKMLRIGPVSLTCGHSHYTNPRLPPLSAGAELCLTRGRTCQVMDSDSSSHRSSSCATSASASRSSSVWRCKPS